MKKMLIIFSLTLLFIGCSEEVVEEQTNKNKEDGTTNEQTEQDRIEEEESEEKEEKEPNNEQAEEAEKETLYEVNDKIWSLDPIDENVNEDVVLITIDDAPDKYALEMAETLKELEVPAIFFVNGHFLETEEEKETLKQIDELGFVIGNHTYSHRSLPDLSEEEQQEEITSVNNQVEEIIGKRPIFFRAPFGQNTDYSRELLKEEDMIIMNWTYGYDWNEEYMNKDALIDVMTNAPELGAGANLLMHDREWTKDALEEIVDGLREKGYDFVDPETIKTN